MKIWIENKKWSSVTAAFAGTWALQWMLPVMGEKTAYTNSIVTIAVFAGLLCLFGKIAEHEFEEKALRWLWPAAVGCSFSVCMVFGVQLDSKESVNLGQTGMWLGILILCVLMTVMVRYFWDRLCIIQRKNHQDDLIKRNMISDINVQSNQTEILKAAQIKFLLFYTAIIFVCYFIVFLAVYPGFFVYDARDELYQVLNQSYTEHHPLLHVLLIRIFVQGGYELTGSYNPGIAFYTVFQMLVMSFVFGGCVAWLRNRGLSKVGQILFTLYFGLFPVLVMFSLCSAKDGLFTGMLLILLLQLKDLCADSDRFFQDKSKLALFILSVAGMMLLRHNGFYAFLAFCPVLLCFLHKSWKKILFGCLAAVCLYLGISSAMSAALQAQPGGKQEMLTVPIMQMARVYCYDRKSMTEDEVETLYRYLPEQNLNKYTPKLSDLVKIGFDNETFAQDSAGFFKLWLRLFIKHPAAYLNAWLMTSYGYWYPDTVIDVYRGNEVFTFTYEDSSYFGFETEEPGVRASKLPFLEEFYRKLSLEVYQQKIPVLSMLFSPGFLFWVMAFCLGYLGYRGRLTKLIPYMVVFLYWLTLLLGPTYLVRYVVFLWVIVPLLIRDCLVKEIA